MLDSLRKPFFFIALILLALAVLVELSSLGFLGTVTSDAKQYDLQSPGFGIPYLALLDGLLFYTCLLMGLSMIIPQRVHGRIQGVATLLVSLLFLIGAIIMILAAILLLTLMVSLLLAVPFGTIVYIGVYSDFEVGPARITLGTLMTLKIAFVVFLILAHQRFLENKGLVLIILSSLLATIIVSFLHGFVPKFLVSITDDIAAIIVAIIAAIWALFFLLGSIPSIIKALRVDRALT